ncbi:unnamed protein product [Adineta ricciae]|uniref:Uncharacterized protein n=1 Tax=Adineta ricciae TaxID=249248 RepID=A0A814EEL3_ADIRI|nr:unnamed protein product [Adineta ricciae]
MGSRASVQQAIPSSVEMEHYKLQYIGSSNFIADINTADHIFNLHNTDDHEDEFDYADCCDIYNRTS